MSIIIHFNTASFISSVPLLSKPSGILRTKAKLEMVPGIDHTDRTVMTDDESSMVDIATSNTLYTHAVNDLKTTNHVFGSCFGLPYQDHNYGAPPPPTPPSYSPCTSPAHANGVPDEDTNLSVVSTSTTNDESQEGSITRCICGFEHDDEYMICCDLCLVWQHVDCMGLDRNNIPETYLCEKCEPRKVDKHKAKVLQTRKKVAMTDSSDSDEEAGNKNAERKQKLRSKRKKNDEKFEKNEQGSGKKNKQLHKNAKERMEAKRSKLRRTKNKESTSTADEEAQDAWEISLEWCEKNFEPALNNQYTPEVQHLARTLPLQGHEQKFMELLLTRHCQIVDGNQKKLVSIYDIPRDQPLIEYVGKFLLASQFHELHPVFSKRLFPFILFYTLDPEEICVDASIYGNEARFVRRSCKPNAEVRHLVHNGNLHMYIASTKAVFKDDEITLPLDFNLKEGVKDLECACESEDCILKYHQKNGSIDICPDKKRKGRKITFSADDDSSHSVGLISPSKLKSVVKSASEHEGKSDHETDEQANERKKKTREERKIDAIMRAFDQMEKAAKRRQQALERQKSHHPKSEESSEKPESSKETSKEDDKCTTASSSETQGGEEEKVFLATPKPKKGKRRRGSGTSNRRRTRTNSGGCDIQPSDESVAQKCSSTMNVDAMTPSDVCIEISNIIPAISITTVTTTSTTSTSTSSPVLKTKRFLLHEWLQEKSETNINPPATSPVSIRTEVKWDTSAANPTCYVQCTKDNPHSSGISAAHLRRSSTSGQIKSFPIKSVSEQGSAKKRWLRQAMFDCNTYDPLTIDPGGLDGLPLDNDYLSPSYHGEMGSPDDTITPLKKRRLMRESVSSPLSPTHNSDSIDTKDIKIVNTDIKCETEVDESQQQLSSCITLDSSDLTTKLKENTFCKINGFKIEHLETKRITCKEEENGPCDLLVDSPFPVENKDSSELLSTVSSNSKEDESSMQNNCDFKEKNHNIENEYIQGDNSDASLNLCQVDMCETDKEHQCTSKNMQSNLLSGENNTLDTTAENVEYKSTLQCQDVKRKINFSSNLSALPSELSENNSKSPNNCDNFDLKSKDSVPVADISEIVVEHSATKQEKLCEEIVHTTLNENCIESVNYESTNDKLYDLVPVLQNSELHTSSLILKNIQDSCNTSSDVKNEQNNDKSIPSNFTNIETTNSELECCDNYSEMNAYSSDTKSGEIPDFTSKTSFDCNEDQSSALKLNCVSATQKRKVSLSEYRMRMKDGSNKRLCTDIIKRSLSSPALSATAIPETLPEQVTLAPLPLFDTTGGSQSPTQVIPKNQRKKKETKCEEGTCTDVIEHRENLTERLKREFGLDDDIEGCTSSSNPPKSISLPLCVQPPPPPPPPRIQRPSQNSMSTATVASPTQFGYPVPTPYVRSSYIVPQVPSAQFIPVQQPVTASIIPPIHSITSPPGVQCNVRPSLLPSPHSFAPSLQGTVLRPSMQHEYSPVNAQNFAALVQHPPPPPPPKSFSHIQYQAGLFK